MSLIGPIAMMIGTSIFLKWYFQSWLSPSVFFSSIWTFFIIAPIIFAPSYPMFSFGLWVIVFFTIAVSIGALIANRFNLIEMNQSATEDSQVIFQSIFLMATIFSIISFMGIVFLFSFGVSRFNLTNSLIDFLVLPNQFSMDRYHGVVVIPTSIRLMMYLLYPASLMGGLSFGMSHTNRWFKILMVLPIVLSIGYAIILTTRSTILLSTILWVAGWFVTRIIKKRDESIKFKIKSLISIGLSMSVFLGIFVGTAWLREAGGDLFVDTVLENVSAYFFGYLSSFTQWIQVYDQKDLLLGMITFAGPADLLGVTERQLGFYNEISILGTAHTNIFTALRGVIHDFSIGGGFLFFALIGFISTLAFKGCHNRNILWSIPLSAFYAFTIYSPLISIFNYNSILFSWFILTGVIVSTPMIKKIF